MTQSRRTFLKSSAALAAASFAPARNAFAATAAAPSASSTTATSSCSKARCASSSRPTTPSTPALDEDRLLKPFRQRAGLPAPGDDMGGWYSWAPLDKLDAVDNGFAPGHSFGQYLSGLARDYAATGLKSTQEKVHRLVGGLAPAISEHFWEGNRFPAYTYDKLSIGLLDAHQFAAAPNALKALDAALDSVSAHLPPGGISRDAQYARPHTDDSFCWDEPYTMPENFLPRLEAGRGQPLSRPGRPLPRRRLVLWPARRGAKRAARQARLQSRQRHVERHAGVLVQGTEKHLRAARNGFDFVRAQSFATGGWGPDESFRKPGSGEVGDSLVKTHSSFETPCGSYAHFKLTRYLLRATRDSRYGDSMERVLYNCILGVKPIKQDGHGFYYSDYNNDGSKFYHPHKWHCCTGTFSQVTADYGISAYFNDGRGIYVNLYVPSRVTWARGGERVSLTS